MADDLNQRIDTMLRGDKLGAAIFVVCLWLAVFFVLVMVWQVVPDGTIRTTLVISAGALLLFNTAAIIAMVRHYEEDKAFIYGLDIRHLDAARAAQSGAAPASIKK
jgi:hypothetical protein